MTSSDVARPTQGFLDDPKQNTLIRALIEISHALDLDAVLTKGMDAIQQVLSADLSCFLLMQSTPPWVEVEKPVGMSDQFIEQLGQLRVDPVWANPKAAAENPMLIFTQLGEHAKAVCRAQGIEYSVLLPLTAPSGPIGALFVGTDKNKLPLPTNVDLILSITEHLGITIENARLLDSVGKRNRELAALNEIASILSRSLELQSSLDLVCAQMTSITGMDTASVYGRDESGQHLNLLAQHGMTPGLLQVAKHLGLDDPVVFQLASAGKPIAINNIQEDTSSSYAGPKAEGYRAGIGVPIFRHGQPTGILFVASRTRTEYDPADVELTLNIGRQIGVAMENAGLYAQMQQRVFELESLTKLSAACATSLEPKALAQTAIDWTRQLLFTDFAVVRFLENGQFQLLANYSAQPRAPLESLPLEPAIVEQLRKRQSIVVDNIHTTNFSAETLELAHATQLEALLAVPLFARDQVIGLVVVGHAQPHKWLPHEVDLLQTIADQVANSLDSARLFQDVVAEQRKVQAIFDSGLSGLYATDADGHIVMFNRAAERMTGWSFDEVRNKKWEDVLRDPTASDRESLIYEALHHGKSAFAYEGQHIRTRDGRIIEAAKAVAPLLDETNQVIGAVGAFWDRSRELVAEYEREEFLQTAAHQLRTPLTSLLLSLDLLQRKNISAKRRAEMMKIARFDGERLKRLADQLLDWRQLVENKSTIRLEPVSIIAATRTLVQESEMTDQAKHRFQVDAPKPEPLVDANLDAVEHIMRNLIDNAINYSPAASMIRVAFTLGPMDRIDISVSDEGPGIPFEEQEKIFQPFYRSESAGKHRQYGHGLGLAIAQRFAKQMDSEIHVESQPGRGSKFYFTLRRHA